MMRAGLWLLLSAVTSSSSAQVFGPRLADPADAQRGTTPRSIILVQQAAEAREWRFHHAVDELPRDLRAVLSHVAGDPVVGPGEVFNDGDEIVVPSNSQHQFTAVAKGLAVMVWYSGGFNGAELHLLIYDRAARDACRYDFGKVSLGPLRLGYLLGMLRGQSRSPIAARCFEAGAV